MHSKTLCIVDEIYVVSLYKCKTPALSNPPRTYNHSNASLDLFRLKLDRFPIYKDALTLVRLRDPPLPNISRELFHHLLLRSFQQYARRLRRARLHAQRDAELDRMRVADLQGDEELSWVLWLDGDCRGFDRRSVSHSD